MVYGQRDGYIVDLYMLVECKNREGFMICVLMQ